MNSLTAEWEERMLRNIVVTTLLRDLFGALIWSDDLNVEPQKELCQIALERPQGEALGEHQDPNGGPMDYHPDMMVFLKFCA